MEISAKQVMELRKATGAGVMDCKKALLESNGDLVQAQDFLRKKGLKTAEKRADRESNEGYVAVSISDDGRHGAILALTSETDFVANTPEFQKFASELAVSVANELPASSDELLARPSTITDGVTYLDDLNAMTAKLGEKMEVYKFGVLTIPEGTQGLVHGYVHLGSKEGTIIRVDAGKDVTIADDKFRTFVNDMALQVVAYSPKALDETGIAQSVIDKELDIYREQLLNEGKPEKIIDQISQGKLRKFFAQNTLLGMGYINDEKTPVKTFLKTLSKELDDEVNIVEYINISIGK